MRRIIAPILALLCAALLSFGSLAYGVYSYGGGASAVTADAAIVLGAAVEGDQPSPVFRERINHGIHLLGSGRVRRIILTGGRPDGFDHPESLVAKQYALQNGVPDDKILTETQSHTTYQNLYYAREVARANGLHTFIVVSDPYHLRRAMRMAEGLSLQAHPSPTPTSRLNDLDFLLRETWRNAKYLARHTLSADAEAEELAVSAH